MKLEGDGKKGAFAYAIGTAGTTLSMVAVGQLTYALTSSAGMAAGTVGVLLLASKIFDGITDLIAGYIIDRTNTRFGKARPYDLMGIILWLLVILCFTVPNFSTVGKVLWVLLTFNLCQSVCYTFCSVAAPVRAKRSFVKEKRAQALALCGFFSAVLATAFNIILPLLIAHFENRPFGWTIISACFAIPCMVFSLLMFLLLPEMKDVEEEEEKKKNNVNFATAVSYFLKNKYALVLVLMAFLCSLANVIGGTFSVYYFKYFVGDLKMQSLVSLISVLGYAFLLLMPLMEKKLSHQKMVAIAFGFVLLGGLGRYINGKNFPVLVIFGTIFTIGITTMLTVRNLALMDCMEYGKKKFGLESEGVYSAVNGFADKLSNGLGQFFVGIILSVGHWDAALTTQPESALRAIQFAFAGLPAILAAFGLVATLFFRVEKELKGEYYAEKSL